MKRDRQAFIDLLDAHQKLIFKVCSMYCRDPEDQKDLVQDVIIQLWNSFDKYDPQYKVSTWLYRIALNTAISYYRKASTRNKHLTVLNDSFLQIAHDDATDSSEKLQLLQQLIGELSELNKALMLLYLDGNSHEEIADILNISVSNVGTKLNRIKQKLKIKYKSVQ